MRVGTGLNLVQSEYVQSSSGKSSIRYWQYRSPRLHCPCRTPLRSQRRACRRVSRPSERPRQRPRRPRSRRSPSACGRPGRPAGASGSLEPLGRAAGRRRGGRQRPADRQ